MSRKTLIDKVLGSAKRKTQDVTNYQGRAIIQQEKIEKGKKILAPHYPSEEKSCAEAREDPTLRELINKKFTNLIKNMGNFTVRSTDPPEVPKSKRDLPKRADEYPTAASFEYEFGFHELPEEKMDKNRLMFREAMEILRTRAELSTDEGDQPQENLFCVDDFMSAHSAVKRVDREKLERVWQYFRPFVRRQEQYTVMRDDILFLHRYIESATGDVDDFPSISDSISEKIGYSRTAYAIEPGEGFTDPELIEKAALRQRDEAKRLRELTDSFYEQQESRQQSNETEDYSSVLKKKTTASTFDDVADKRTSNKHPDIPVSSKSSASTSGTSSNSSSN